MHRFRNKMLLIPMALATGCSSPLSPPETTPARLSSRVGPENGVALLGQAFDRRKEEFLGSCVTSQRPENPVSVIYAGAPTARVDLTKVTRWEDLNAVLDVQVSGKLKYPTFNVTGAARFVSDAKATDSSYSMVYSAGIRGKNAILAEPVLSKDGLAHKATLDDAKVRTACGDSYVSQVELGAQYLVQVRFDFANTQAKSEFDAKLRFEYLNLFEVEGAAKVLSENAKKNATISISALQVGGQVEKLLGTLSADVDTAGTKNYAVLTCAIDNAKACISTLNGFLAYATDESNGFPSQLKDLKYDTSSPGGAAVLGYVTTQYEKGSASTRTLFEAPPPTIGAAVRDARHWLANRYDALASDSRRAEQMGRLYLTDEQKDALDATQKKISESTKALLDVVGICYSDIDACAPAKSGLESLLTTEAYSYNPNALTKVYTFVDYCRLPELSKDAQTTVDALKAHVGRADATDCLDIYADLQATSVLDLARKDLKDVRPLRGLTRVRTLDLSGNAIRNASPLFELTGLRSLKLRRNAISALDGLETLSELRTLDVADNRIDDIVPVLSLSNLEELRAQGNLVNHGLALDPRWDLLARLRHRTLSDAEACKVAASTVVKRGEMSQEVADMHLDLEMGPVFQRDGDVHSPFEGWAACGVAARYL